ncbi:MAG: CaiB/BaiF CoA transferase family protein [Acidimicrobiia bacterium]
MSGSSLPLRPLAGLRVVDCSFGTAAPRATAMLADYGADVIWVEPPGGHPDRADLAIEYAVFGRGKRSVELDLSTSVDVERLHQLLATADVFVESWMPGEAERLGLGYEAVHARYPSLVMASVSPFGADGPNRDLRGAESIVHAIVGTTGEQSGHRPAPVYSGLPFASIGAGYLAVLGIVSALYRRVDDGVGRHVETSLLDGALSYLSMLWGNHDGPGVDNPMIGTYRIINKAFLCADDTYVAIHTGAVGAFGRLMVALGLDDKVKPSADGLDLGRPLTPEEKEVLDTRLEPILRSQPRQHWIDLLRAADVCCIPLLHAGEVFDEAQTKHNDMVWRIDDPVLGPIDQVASPAKFAGTQRPVPSAAPTAGQHTAEVFAELASLKRAPITASGVVDDRPLLAGVNVVDFGAFYAGPYSSRLLGDLGADVIKLEPLGGDPVRGLERVFRSASANKRSISANLKDPGLAAARERLLQWADVVHHNMRPGAAERVGVGYDDCKAVNPEVVYVYAPGWGATGPDQLRQSFAPLMSGYVGVHFEAAGRYNEPVPPVGNEDPGNGLVGAVAMVIGLLRKRQGHGGTFVENPQLNATMTHLAHIVRRPDGEVLGAGRLDTMQMGVAPSDRLYQAADGWIAVGAATAEQRTEFAKIVGIAGADVSASTAIDDGVWLACEEVIAAHSVDHWMRMFGEAGVACARPAEKNNNDAVMRDAEYQQLGRVSVIDHPAQSKVRQMGTLVRVSHTMPATPTVAPGLGQHTEAILGELGYDAATIADLRTRSAIRG